MSSPRIPLPPPVEETQHSNQRPSSSANDVPADGSPSEQPRRESPQPVETTSKSSIAKKHIGQGQDEEEENDASHDLAVGITSTTIRTASLPQPMESTASTGKPRRFAPQMVETTRRSRRNTDAPIGMPETDKTDHLPHPPDGLPPHLRRKSRPGLTPVPGPPLNSPMVSTDQLPHVTESKFSSSKLVEKLPRRHSFHVPDLPAITSTSETEEDSSASDVPSLATSPTAESGHSDSHKRKRKSKQSVSERRESQDARFSGYLLALAASAADKQLRDQAMAAYANEIEHEPVDHYAVDREWEDLDEEVHMGQVDVGGATSAERDEHEKGGGSRRESAAGWEMAEMRQHQDLLQRQRQDAWASSHHEKQPEMSRRHSFKANLADGTGPIQQAGALPNGNPGCAKDTEINPQRKAASPPMAGQDLRFAKCLSPQATRMDVHQYPGAPHTTGTETRQHTGLWTPCRKTSEKRSQSGLWLGVNAASAQPVGGFARAIQTGLLTPAIERFDPFNQPSSNTIATTTRNDSSTITSSPPISIQQQEILLPPSPPASQPSDPTPLQPSRSVREGEQPSDEFVTQIYNYLSLGYPTLARPYDHELSHVTNTPLSALRKDDDKPNHKGYIGAPEGTGLDVRGVRQGACERWLALKKYVGEWTRQQALSGWGEEEAYGGRGVAVRKGSWAW
ncbi:MAG: hypothetical protein Q9163_003789 [Psora crenata]